MTRHALAHRMLCLFSLVCIVVAALPVTLPVSSVFAQTRPTANAATLYRTTITLRQPTDRAQLAKIGVTVLRDGATQILVLVNAEQLATLARLRFEPQGTDEFAALTRANLASAGSGASLQQDLSLIAPQSMTPIQLNAVAELVSVDSDSDGLTDTQEGWWCTNPNLADSDSDRTSDGAEVQALKDWMGNRSSGPPASGKPFLGWPLRITNCYDDDMDSVPDQVEIWDLGLNPNIESTDRDKFDDGQELFGNTYCPGSGGFCGYGVLPRNEDWGVITASMPSWVKAPGNHPLVAAFPTPEVDVVESSLHVGLVTTVTTDHTMSSGTEKTYSTAKTEGTSSSVADTVTWNDWEEVSISSPMMVSTNSINPSFNTVGEPQSIGIIGPVIEKMSTAVTTLYKYCKTPKVANFLNCISIYEYTANGLLKGFDWIGSVVAPKKECYLSPIPTNDPDACQNQNKPNTVPQSCVQPQNQVIGFISATGYSCSPGNGVVLASSTEYLKNQVPGANSQNQFVGGSGSQIAIQSGTGSTSQPYYQMSFPMAQPMPTVTNSSGQSRGGAQTTTHTQYEEQTITNGEAFSSGEAWGTATAVDSSHAADLWFTYKVRNTGMEYAREIGNLAFNLYLNDNPNPITTYFVAPDLGGDGKFHNFMPAEEHTYTSVHLPLSLEQLKALDVDPACAVQQANGLIPAGQACPGGKLRIVVEDYTYGIDELFYQDAINAGVRIAIEDGTDDGNELIDSYVIPTWGQETVLNVLARYFPNTTDAQGNLVAIWTPEYRADTPTWCVEPRRTGTTLWCKKALSTAEWWNVYLNGLGNGTEGFQNTPAAAGTVALFRFNQDTDHDGYSDRSERKLGTDPRDAASVPHPELLAGLANIRAGANVTATLSLLNTGVYDAYGVEAIMVAPDDSISITNNTVGGSGRVRALKQVVVGSRIQPPTYTSATWRATAKPASGGYYTGTQDRTYTITASCGDANGCDVGVGTWSLGWNDGTASGTLSFGAGYASPRMLDVGTLGVKLSLLTGKVFNGDTFTISALTPRDTFQYHINREPFTPPLVIVSYNDPQGNHRVILPPAAMALTKPDDSLQPFTGQMLPDVGIDLVTSTPFTPGANTTRIVVNNPSGSTLTNARLHLEFIDPLGAVTSEVSTTTTLAPGPTIVPLNWNSVNFTPVYSATQDYIVLAFWTDYQGNILDTAGRPLSSFQADPTPRLMSDPNTTWSFGTVSRGTLLSHGFSFANTGGFSLFTYIAPLAGVSMTRTGNRQVGPADITTYDMALNTTDLPVGPYDQTVTIRTSDPSNPVQTVRMVGTITNATLDAAGGTVQRPMDWTVNVPAGQAQGVWLDFTHTLGPDPQSLHPVKIYSQDYAKLWGVGKYATQFGTGTASADMFGDGRDGVMPGSGNLDNNNGFGTGAVNSGSAGTTSINVTDTYGGWRIQPGDAVLIHQTQGTGAGCWEVNRAASDYVGGTTAIQLVTPLKCTYISDSGSNHAQILRIPQYSTCNVTGTITPLYAWNGSTGGIFAVMCQGSMTVSGAINANGYGYRGASQPDNYARATGRKGESYVGNYNALATSAAANYSGGGGAYNNNADAGSAGGGGGYATVGGNGLLGHATNGSGPGQGGTIVGDQNLIASLYMGGGGGSGSNSYTAGSGNDFGGAGGSGGGFVLLSTQNLIISGLVQSDGSNGVDATGHATGGGGAGAGGAVVIQTKTALLGGSLIHTRGGAGGRGGAFSINGGIGGVGRVLIRYCESYTGDSDPLATTQKLNCYIAEQTETTPYTTGRLNLPEASGTGKAYQVQYGRRLTFAGAGEVVTSLRVPGGVLTNATLDALLSEVGSGTTSLSLDIGNNGTWDWQQTKSMTNSDTLTSGDLAAAFSDYWVSQGGAGGTIDVPVRVALSKAGTVMLSNLKITPAGSRLRALRLPVASYITITLNLAVGTSGSGPLTIAADVGDNGSLDWSWSGEPAFPARLTTGNLATAINAYMLGRSGEVDVPIRFYVNPYLPVSLSSASVAQSPTKDVSVIAGDISFSAGGIASLLRAAALAATIPLNALTPTEGDTITVSAIVRNPSTKPSGGLTAALVATVPGWGDWYIGSQYIADIPPGGTAQISLPWKTTGFSGSVPVKVIIDPYNRTSETNETNNHASVNLSIQAAVAPAVSLAPTSLTFAAQTNGTTSTAQSVTLTNSGSAVLNIAGISASGDFAQTNTCAATLAAGANCTISVTFTPTVAGSRTGTLTVTSNAFGSPHSIGLTGTGVSTPLPTGTTVPLTSTPTATSVATSTSTATSATTSTPTATSATAGTPTATSATVGTPTATSATSIPTATSAASIPTATSATTSTPAATSATTSTPIRATVTPTAIPANVDTHIGQYYQLTGKELSLTITIGNNGPDNLVGAIVDDPLPDPAPGTTWTWTCTATSGADCGISLASTANQVQRGTTLTQVTGTGNIKQQLGHLPVGGSVVFTVTGTLNNVQRWSNTPVLILPSGTVNKNGSLPSAPSVGRFQVMIPLIRR